MARRTMSRRVPSARAPKMRSKSMVLFTAVCIDTTIRLYDGSVNGPLSTEGRHGRVAALVCSDAMAALARRIVSDSRFNGFIVAVILVNAVLVGLETSEEL